MHLTNRLGLPEPFVRAVAWDGYSHGDADISVTALIGPARKRVLERRHRDDLSGDAADRVWSLFGQVVHGVLARAGGAEDSPVLTEHRLTTNRQSWRISGTFDRLDRSLGLLQDYKVTSADGIGHGVKPEHEAQLNLYALLAREHGFEVTQLEVVAILRDWRRGSAAYRTNYPAAPVVVLPVRLWSEAEAESFLMERVKAHRAAEQTLPECSPAERWARPTTWAVTKIGAKRALSVHESLLEAEAALHRAQVASARIGLFALQERAGCSARCNGFCDAAMVCQQWQALQTAAS